jgi:hypothetical protein
MSMETTQPKIDITPIIYIFIMIVVFTLGTI